MRPRLTEGRGGLNEVLNQPVATLYGPNTLAYMPTGCPTKFEALLYI